MILDNIIFATLFSEIYKFISSYNSTIRKRNVYPLDLIYIIIIIAIRLIN